VALLDELLKSRQITAPALLTDALTPSQQGPQAWLQQGGSSIGRLAKQLVPQAPKWQLPFGAPPAADGAGGAGDGAATSPAPAGLEQASAAATTADAKPGWRPWSPLGSDEQPEPPRERTAVQPPAALTATDERYGRSSKPSPASASGAQGTSSAASSKPGGSGGGGSSGGASARSSAAAGVQPSASPAPAEASSGRAGTGARGQAPAGSPAPPTRQADQKADQQRLQALDEDLGEDAPDQDMTAALLGRPLPDADSDMPAAAGAGSSSAAPAAPPAPLSEEDGLPTRQRKLPQLPALGLPAVSLPALPQLPELPSAGALLAPAGDAVAEFLDDTR
jgi:hypothetical protein